MVCFLVERLFDEIHDTACSMIYQQPFSLDFNWNGF